MFILARQVFAGHDQLHVLGRNWSHHQLRRHYYLGRLMGFCRHRAGAEPDLGDNFTNLLHGRALTIGMIGIVGVLLVFSVLVTSLVVGLREMAGRVSPRQAAHYPLLLSVAVSSGRAFSQSQAS